ncbi:class A beta-lactamase-related serine hydrolase [Aetokthonos hydrillicola Thurmond2011]|jgi:hypothetical protein|uniref:Class A beta-lactamase-related serine hydrolase n=3 Tax=Aetokthonos TaxID=1550243 RepID=A0AAP5I9G2_9CYAN|nr:serine hydrolase [Aetokthonos hydrillicola]MDR9896022.1 class A beta-lactamase-related serine hydrolase [Aetokthonos hydrillicola Thurmond2011]
MKHWAKQSTQKILASPTVSLGSLSHSAKQAAFNLPTATPVLIDHISPKQGFNSTQTPLLPDWASAKSHLIPSRYPGKENSEVTYNLKTPPSFRQSEKLQAIVNNVVHFTAAKNLPTKMLSITLIDTKTGEIAGYQQDIPRYPASVVKMFWMVVLYAQIESGIWKNEDAFIPYLSKMIKESDNEAASFIVDQVTNTHSEPELDSKRFKIWKNKRQQLNRFFQQAGYKNINISEKTFPIYYINLPEPTGSELQMLGSPISEWNKITTKQAARLLYEICELKQAVSPQASQKMCEWITRNLNPKNWQKDLAKSDTFNPVKTFFGESLFDKDVQLHSKAGWVSIARSEAAMVTTENSSTSYILAIFGEDSSYANDTEIFPQISRLVYNYMTSRSLRLSKKSNAEKHFL